MNPPRHRLLALTVALLAAPSLRAGLYYSGEILNEMPAKWQGFISDHRLLRNVARKPTPKLPASPMRERYQKAVADLEKQAKAGKLSADAIADLGALHVRLGNATEAVSVLRGGAKAHSSHFRILANLGAAYQALGELRFASIYLREALRFAPTELREAEALHLKLARLRLNEAEGTQALDDLFGMRFVSDAGKYEATKLAVEQRKKLPANATALVQQLALWLPHDGRLLWQLAELASAHGNARIASAMMDGCVTEFLMRDRDLRAHRLLTNQAAQAQLKAGPLTKASHEKHGFPFRPKSDRPLANRFFKMVLPAIKPDGVNPMFWEVVTQTALDRQYRPTFPKYLQELDGKRIEMKGYVQPLAGNDLEMTSFLLIEYPVGCWYCEVPQLVAMIYVELPLDDTFRFSRDLVRVTGKLKLNSTDPEDFLYQVRDAKVDLVR